MEIRYSPIEYCVLQLDQSAINVLLKGLELLVIYQTVLLSLLKVVSLMHKYGVASSLSLNCPDSLWECISHASQIELSLIDFGFQFVHYYLDCTLVHGDVTLEGNDFISAGDK